ncbi:MAG TPA: Crp/Fnr family transcriptional regulator [Solirubrobacterales bacterium]|nr:Crp/Fnr family transcriptional regulator [Solirubrobacterales bacterium]
MTSVPVLRLDPDLGAAVAVESRGAAVRACGARVLDLPRGNWDADSDEGAPARAGFGLLALSGVLCRRVVQSERYGAELIGSGDLMRPWDRIGEWSTIPTDSSWTVIEPARLAVLDADFARRAAPFPEIALTLARRALMRSRYLAILIAIVSQRRVETRLTMLFWHLADRFGQRHGEWVEIPVPLTHSLLGELVAARRPTVTTALTRLDERGVLRREGRGWRLSGTVPPELETLR